MPSLLHFNLHYFMRTINFYTSHYLTQVKNNSVISLNKTLFHVNTWKSLRATSVMLFNFVEISFLSKGPSGREAECPEEDGKMLFCRRDVSAVGAQ